MTRYIDITVEVSYSKTDHNLLHSSHSKQLKLKVTSMGLAVESVDGTVQPTDDSCCYTHAGTKVSTHSNHAGMSNLLTMHAIQSK